jgi:hypothetical protein
MTVSPSVVINDLNIYRAGRSLRPFKAYPPLVIDADAVLAFAIAFQPFKAVAGQRRKIPDPRGRFQPVKLQPGGPLNAGKGFNPLPGGKIEGAPVPIADDHSSLYRKITLYVKRNEARWDLPIKVLGVHNMLLQEKED